MASATDERHLDIGNDSADHQPDDKRKASQSVDGFLGRRRYRVALDGHIENRQGITVRSELLELPPWSDQQQRVADRQRLMQKFAAVSDDAPYWWRIRGRRNPYEAAEMKNAASRGAAFSLHQSEC